MYTATTSRDAIIRYDRPHYLCGLEIAPGRYVVQCGKVCLYVADLPTAESKARILVSATGGRIVRE